MTSKQTMVMRKQKVLMLRILHFINSVCTMSIKIVSGLRLFEGTFGKDYLRVYAPIR
jgi:cytochrome b subunit of formate dehydrogenase